MCWHEHTHPHTKARRLRSSAKQRSTHKCMHEAATLDQVADKVNCKMEKALLTLQDMSDEGEMQNRGNTPKKAGTKGYTHPNSMSNRSRSQSRERIVTVSAATSETCNCPNIWTPIKLVSFPVILPKTSRPRFSHALLDNLPRDTRVCMFSFPLPRRISFPCFILPRFVCIHISPALVYGHVTKFASFSLPYSCHNGSATVLIYNTVPNQKESRPSPATFTCLAWCITTTGRGRKAPSFATTK